MLEVVKTLVKIDSGGCGLRVCELKAPKARSAIMVDILSSSLCCVCGARGDGWRTATHENGGNTTHCVSVDCHPGPKEAIQYNATQCKVSPDNAGGEEDSFRPRCESSFTTLR